MSKMTPRYFASVDGWIIVVPTVMGAFVESLPPYCPVGGFTPPTGLEGTARWRGGAGGGFFLLRWRIGDVG